VKDNMFPLPPLFRIIHEQSGTPWSEMYKVFNMGHRFEIYTRQECASEIINIASGFNLEARIVGYCDASEKKKLTISSEFGTFEY
jgi:phosphoribosylformylglycinamidine cyclo-ligase